MNSIRKLVFTMAISAISIPVMLHAQPDRTRSILLLVTPRGIFPQQLTLRPGPVSIAAIGKTGHSQLSLKIVRTVGNGPELGRQNVAAGKSPRSGPPIIFTPGEYEISVDGAPSLLCRVTVQP